ncbi:MAG: hypothetical protein SV062_04525 [Thermodesulfobacteriota bacterium]|nr:hypothetical protein [Thermodesulfobacteriota bacterium]
MKTGIIIYIAGSHKIRDDFDIEFAVKKLNIRADRIEVVSPMAGHFSIMDAWWMHLIKGMSRIICLFAEMADNSELKFTGRELRLCG